MFSDDVTYVPREIGLVSAWPFESSYKAFGIGFIFISWSNISRARHHHVGLRNIILNSDPQHFPRYDDISETNDKNTRAVHNRVRDSSIRRFACLDRVNYCHCCNDKTSIG